MSKKCYFKTGPRGFLVCQTHNQALIYVRPMREGYGFRCSDGEVEDDE